MAKKQTTEFDVSKYPYYSLKNKTLNMLALEVMNKPKLLTDQDVIFEGNGQKAIDGNVISMERITAEDIAFLLSDMNKPIKWKGKVILLGDYTSALCTTVSKVYYEFTGNTIEVLGFKNRLSALNEKDDTVMWFSSGEKNNLVFGSEYKTIEDYCDFLEDIPNDLDEEFQYIHKLYADYFEFILKEDDKRTDAFKKLQKDLANCNLEFKVAIKNTRVMSSDVPLYCEKFAFNKIFSEITDFLNSCLCFTEEKMYRKLESISLEELPDWIVPFEKKLNLKKKELKKIIKELNKFINFLKSKKIKKVLDLSDEDTTFTVRYAPEIEN